MSGWDKPVSLSGHPCPPLGNEEVGTVDLKGPAQH